MDNNSKDAEKYHHWSQRKGPKWNNDVDILGRSKSEGLEDAFAGKRLHLPPLEAIFDSSDYLQASKCSSMLRNTIQYPIDEEGRTSSGEVVETQFSKRLLAAEQEESQAVNNRLNERSSFDMLISGRTMQDSGKNRRRSESSAMLSAAKGGYVPRPPTHGVSAAESLRAPLLVSGQSHVKKHGTRDFESSGLMVNTEPNIQRKPFRAGPSEGAHASQLVDQQTQKSHAITIIDADLHDTFGAHDWMPTKKAERTPALRKFSVSKAPSLSPIRSQLSSPVGSPVTSPPRNVVASNVSYLSPIYLERRKLAQMYPKDSDSDSGRGYIAEAKRVLDEAMHLISNEQSDAPHEVSLSHSGALDPLLKHLKSVAGDNTKCRSALRTLALLETNLPNRQIISDLQGRRILMDVVRKCSDIDVQEKAIQLLWDLDMQAGRNAASILTQDDLLALGNVLCSTQECEIASHTIHFLKHSLDQPPESRPFILFEFSRVLADKLTSEACAHKHHLPDAAQYCLGETLGVVLSDLTPADSDHAKKCLEDIIGSLMNCNDDTQCQVLLTVLSSLAVRRKLRGILGELGAMERVLSFTENTSSARLQARGYSLLKALSNKIARNPTSSQGSWYFNDSDHLD